MWRTSNLISNDTSPISEERWQKFLNHVYKVNRYLAGFFQISDDKVLVDFGRYTESVFFSRDFKELYHKDQDFYDNYRETVAALFLLFRQDCLDNQPHATFCGSPWITQGALDILRKAGVWEEGEKCLVAFEDIETEYNETIKAANTILEAAWNESEIPDALHITALLRDEIGRHMPQSFLQGRDYDPYYEDWWIGLVLGRYTARHAKYIYCEERERDSNKFVGKRWFVNKNAALNFISGFASQEELSKLKSIFDFFIYPDKTQFETQSSIFTFNTVHFKDLPHDHTFDLMRQICKLTANSLNHVYQDNLTEKIREALSESNLSEEKRQKALSMSFVRLLKITMPDGEEMSYAFLPFQSRIDIYHQITRKINDWFSNNHDNRTMLHDCTSQMCEMDRNKENNRILDNGIHLEWKKIYSADLMLLSATEQEEEDCALAPG